MEHSSNHSSKEGGRTLHALQAVIRGNAPMIEASTKDLSRLRFVLQHKEGLLFFTECAKVIKAEEAQHI